MLFSVTAVVLHPLINGHAQLLLSAMSAGKVVLLLLQMSYKKRCTQCSLCDIICAKCTGGLSSL